MRSWLQAVCSATPQGRLVLDEVEAYCLYLILQFQPTDENFIVYTDAWIRRIIGNLQEPVTAEFVFLLCISCFSEEWIIEHLGSTLSSLDAVGEDGILLFYNFLVSRYKKITDDDCQVQNLSNIVENFQLDA